MNTINYITSLLTFYLKGEICSEQNFIQFKEPNTILGLIPLGAKSERIAINQISSVTTNTKMKLGKLIIGIVIAVLALISFKDSFLLGLIILIIAVNSIVDAFEIDLEVDLSSGQKKAIDFFIFEKSKAEHASIMINEMISNRLDDTNSRQQTDRIVATIKNK